MTRLNRMLVVLVLLTGYQLSSGATVRAEMLPECVAVCDASADCFEACEYGTEYGWVNTICGEYEYGSAGGYCDHSTWDTCNYLCAYDGDDETECLMDGEAFTCESYDIYLSYNDGFCSPAEYCGTSADCGACAPELPPSSTGSGYLSNLQIKSACELATEPPYNYQVTCPEVEWVDEPETAQPQCATKNAKIAQIRGIMDYLKGLVTSGWSGAAYALYLVEQVYYAWQGTPCYIYT